VLISCGTRSTCRRREHEIPRLLPARAGTDLEQFAAMLLDAELRDLVGGER
jgi:hypothetical protein